MLQFAMVFTDHMVLQRDRKIAVWGTASPDSTVSIEIQGKKEETKTGADGNWRADIGPLTVSFDEQMHVVERNDQGAVIDEKTFTDVLVGDVWLAGGQSNMEFYMYYDRELEAEKKVCENPAIRLFDYPEVSYVGQINEADYTQNYGFWRRCDAENLPRYSAVAYYFAKDVQAKEQIPIGILTDNWGGTPIASWLPREVVAENGGQYRLDEYDAALAALDLDAYDKQFMATPRNFKTEQLGLDRISDLLLFGCTPEEFQAEIAKIMQQLGIDPAAAAEGGTDLMQFGPQMGPKHEWRPCGLYESMLLPVVPYGIKGFLWYQGCSDADTQQQGEAYYTLFPALIAHWRKLWGDDTLPFLFVQLAGFGSWMASVGTYYPITREAQQHTALTVPHTGMAVTTDAGMELDIHPKVKRPVGHRLALLAENYVYGHRDVLCEAPTLVSAKAEEGKLTLTFDNAGEGLSFHTDLPQGDQVPDDRFCGLQVFQNGKELPVQDLKAEAQGNTVILTGEVIKGGVPTRAAIAKTGWYLVNLYNSADIPARPAEIEC